MDLVNELGDLSENETLLRSDSFLKIWKLLKRHESCLKQKSRSEWFNLGDANTTYFHKYASFRRKRNPIKGLMINDDWVENPDSMKEEATHYFRRRFTPANRPNLNFRIEPLKKFTDSDRRWLTRQFSAKEIKEVVWE